MVAQFAGSKAGVEGLADVLMSAAVAGGGGGGSGMVVDWAVQVTLDKEAGSGFRTKSLGVSVLRGCFTFMHRAVGYVAWNTDVRGSGLGLRHSWMGRALAVQYLLTIVPTPNLRKRCSGTAASCGCAS